MNDIAQIQQTIGKAGLTCDLYILILFKLPTTPTESRKRIQEAISESGCLFICFGCIPVYSCTLISQEFYGFLMISHRRSGRDDLLFFFKPTSPYYTMNHSMPIKVEGQRTITISINFFHVDERPRNESGRNNFRVKF